VKSLLLFVSLAFAFSQTASAQKAFFKGTSLMILDGRERLEIPSVSDRSDIAPTAPCVHALAKRDGAYFILLTRSRWLHGRPRMGFGGAGSFSCITWMRIVDQEKALKEADAEETKAAFVFAYFDDDREAGTMMKFGDRWYSSYRVGTKVVECVDEDYESWRDNREGKLIGWRGPIFTVVTEDLLEDDEQNDAKTRVVQRTTVTFDARRPQDGLKLDRAKPRAMPYADWLEGRYDWKSK
jgi:hypothetical protein